MRFFFIATILISTFCIYVDYGYAVETVNIVNSDNSSDVTDNVTPTDIVAIDNATDNATPTDMVAIDNVTDNATPTDMVAIDNVTDNATPTGMVAIDNVTDNETPTDMVAIDNATDNETPTDMVVADNATDNEDDPFANGLKLDRRGNSYLYLMLAGGADADNYITRHFGGFFVGATGGWQLFNWFAVELGFTYRQALLQQLEFKTAVFLQPVVPIGTRFEIVPRIGLGMINTFSMSYADPANKGLNANMGTFTNMLFVIGLRFNIDDRYIIGIIGENDIFGVSQRYRYGLEFGIKF